jgi:hypothetical protein
MVRNAPNYEFCVQRSRSSAFIAKNLYATRLVNQCVNGTSSAQFAPTFMQYWNGLKHPKIWVFGPMEWIGCVHCERFRRNFVSWTCELPVRPILHRLSCVTKQSEMPSNISVWSIGVDRVHSFQKIPTQLCFMNLYINGTSSAYFAPSNETVRNTPKHELWIQWSGSGAFVAKNSDTTSCVNGTNLASFAPTMV